MGNFITVLVLSVVLPLVFALLGFLRYREEIKIKRFEGVKLRYSKAITGIFIVLAIIFIAVIIVFAVMYFVGEFDFRSFMAGFLTMFFFTLICGIGIVICTGSYFVIGEDGISVKQPFVKIKKYSFDEIYCYVSGDVLTGGLAAYDKDGRRLFEVSYYQTGCDKLAEIFESKGVERVLGKLVSAKFKNSEIYKQDLKKHNVQNMAWLLAFTALFLIMIACIVVVCAF